MMPRPAGAMPGFRVLITEHLMPFVVTHSPKRKAKFLNQVIVKFLVLCMI